MNGPENFREAGRLAALVLRNSGSSDAVALGLVALTRATLALAAATALNDHSHDEGGMRLEDYDAWAKVASVWKPRQKGGEN
jgi:Spy/CpxP family protein refolding chaperone